MKIDNRWHQGFSCGYRAPDEGASDPPVDIPEFRAAYGARWIDQGPGARPGIVGDRQGTAYDDPDDRMVLLDAMTDVLRSTAWGDLEREVAIKVAGTDTHGIECWVRRSGGYFYVDAWLR